MVVVAGGLRFYDPFNNVSVHKTRLIFDITLDSHARYRKYLVICGSAYGK